MVPCISLTRGDATAEGGQVLPVERARGPIAEDLALLRAFVGGDDAAFVELARRHGRLVLGLVRRYARDREEARDLAQQVFLRAVQASERASSRGELHVRGWLAQIALLAKNARRDSVRRTEAGAGPARPCFSSGKLERALKAVRQDPASDQRYVGQDP